MEEHPQQRCYRAGGAVSLVRCTVESALSSKDVSALKSALWALSRAGKEASEVIPEAKDISHKIAFRGKMLYRIADDLGEKAASHERFFSDQLRSLIPYAVELEKRSYNSCLDKVYEDRKLDKLPSVPKNVAASAKKEKDRRAKAVLARNPEWARQVAEIKRRRAASLELKRKRASK